MRRTLVVALALVCATACSKSGSTSPATSNTGNNNNPTPTGTGGNTTPGTVNATTSDSFDPPSLTVSVGTTVSFIFAAVAHNVTFAAATGAPASIGDTANATVTRTFSTAGTFSYQCTIHTGMTGTITVQ